MTTLRSEAVVEFDVVPEFPTSERLYGAIVPLEDIRPQVPDERVSAEIEIVSHNTIAVRGVELVLARDRIFFFNASRLLDGEPYSPEDLLNLGFQTPHTAQKAKDHARNSYRRFSKELEGFAGREVIERRIGGSEGVRFWLSPTVAVVDHRPGITAEPHKERRRAVPLSRREILRRAVLLFGDDPLVQREVLNLTQDSNQGKRRHGADSMGAHMHETGRYRLLKNKTEIPELFGRIDRGVAAALEISDWEHLFPMQEALLRDMTAAREVVYYANLRLVTMLAARFFKRGLTALEVVQEGNIGLAAAIANFDVSKGFQFSTYASTWIKKYIRKAIAEQSRTIQLPEELHIEHSTLLHHFHEQGRKYGKELTVEERIAASGKSKEEYELLMQAGRQTLVSLDAPIGYDENESLLDFLADQPASNTGTEIIDDQVVVASMLKAARLSNRQLFVLGLSFGLDPRLFAAQSDDTGLVKVYRDAWGARMEEGHSVVELGVMLGSSNEAVRLIKYRAMKKLRAVAAARELLSDPE